MAPGYILRDEELIKYECLRNPFRIKEEDEKKDFLQGTRRSLRQLQMNKPIYEEAINSIESAAK